jgi:hypothetical protein
MDPSIQVCVVAHQPHEELEEHSSHPLANSQGMNGPYYMD